MQYPLFAGWLFLSTFLVEKYRGNAVLIYQNEISVGDPRIVLTEQKAACGYALLMVMAAFCKSAEAFVWVQFGKTGYLKYVRSFDQSEGMATGNRFIIIRYKGTSSLLVHGRRHFIFNLPM